MRVQEMEKHVVISAPYSSMQEQDMEEHIVIVGGGIAGLTLHRLGLQSLVLESSENLRITGFAITLMTNAWRALDALGIGNYLREHYPLVSRFRVGSSVSGFTSENESPDANEGYESHCVRRKELLETLERELPHGTIGTRLRLFLLRVEDTTNSCT